MRTIYLDFPPPPDEPVSVTLTGLVRLDTNVAISLPDPPDFADQGNGVWTVEFTEPEDLLNYSYTGEAEWSDGSISSFSGQSRLSHSLRGHVSLDENVIWYAENEPDRFQNDSVYVDLDVRRSVGADDPARLAKLEEARTAIRTARPSAVLPTYMSSRLARNTSDKLWYPGEAHDLEDFTEDQLMDAGPTGETGEFVDYSQTVARGQLVDRLVQEADDRGQPVLYTDNWVDDNTLPGFTSTDVTIAFMAEVTTGLHGVSVDHWVNAAVSFGYEGVTDEDVAGYVAACDGITLETVMSEFVRSSTTRIGRWKTSLQAFISAGKVVVFIPTETDPTLLAAQARFYAGLAIVLNGPVVSYPFFLPNPEWQLWPQTYGVPTGGIVQDGFKLTREFGEVTFVVDCSDQSVTITDGTEETTPTSPFFTYDQFIRRWGQKNVTVASNKDSTSSEPDLDSVQDAFDVSTSEIYQAFSGGIYAVPLDFTPNDGIVPAMLKHWAMVIAFAYLYDARGQDEKDRAWNKISIQLKNVYMDMAQYRAGLKQLPAELSGEAPQETSQVSAVDVFEASPDWWYTRYPDAVPVWR
jgi:hypothetical protein